VSSSFISIVAYLVVFIAHAFTLIPRCSPSMSCRIFTAGGIGLTEVMALSLRRGRRWIGPMKNFPS
jgi:hypothetical protein